MYTSFTFADIYHFHLNLHGRIMSIRVDYLLPPCGRYASNCATMHQLMPVQCHHGILQKRLSFHVTYRTSLQSYALHTCTPTWYILWCTDQRIVGSLSKRWSLNQRSHFAGWVVPLSHSSVHTSCCRCAHLSKKWSHHVAKFRYILPYICNHPALSGLPGFQLQSQ